MSEPTGGANLTAAEYYLDIGRPDKALSELQTAGSNQLNNPDYWYLRGLAFCEQKQLREAAQAAHKGLALAPEDISLLYLLCNIESKNRNLGAAEKAILAALRQEPDNTQLLGHYALLVAEGGQLDKAERLLAEARTLDPDDPFVVRVGMILSHLRGADEDVLRSGLEALSIEPEDVYGNYMMGHALASQGKVKKAKRYFDSAARLEPTDIDITGAAHSARFLNHPLMLPLRPLLRIGRTKFYLTAIITILLLRQLGYDQAAFIFLMIYFALVVYSWVAPPLLQRWLQRKRRPFR